MLHNLWFIGVFNYFFVFFLPFFKFFLNYVTHPRNL